MRGHEKGRWRHGLATASSSQELLCIGASLVSLYQAVLAVDSTQREGRSSQAPPGEMPGAFLLGQVSRREQL